MGIRWIQIMTSVFRPLNQGRRDGKDISTIYMILTATANKKHLAVLGTDGKIASKSVIPY
jgi:hypothetical protein